jgi:ribosomal protein L22
MKIEVVTSDQAKAQAKTARVSNEQETQVLDMLRNLTKDEGVIIQLDDGESLSGLKRCIETVAGSEGISVTVKTPKRKKMIVVWRNS